MSPRPFHLAAILVVFSSLVLQGSDEPPLHTSPRRLVILKVDGLNADLLYRTMEQLDPETGKSKLPWLSHVFAQNGTIFRNFYTRGISLSAPSWSMLDTGRHTIIRGNVEYDRFTGHVYDYLNFFPFYLGYAKKRQMDMPAVQVLDRAGIPLLIDSYPHGEAFQSFQLYQRGVRWSSLQQALRRGFSTKALVSMVEDGGGPSLSDALDEQTEHDLKQSLQQPEIFYADFFIGDVDHEGHATNQQSVTFGVLQQLDMLTGRLWTAIQASPLARDTLLVMVSDHGMNNVPGVFSQGYSLPDLFNSSEGGAHHVITNRHQLQDYKLAGLNPLVSRVINPSNASLYLAGQSDQYPTAWLDLDGNERAAVHLRNSDLNKVHILLQVLARSELASALRKAVVADLNATIDRHRGAWNHTANELSAELEVLTGAIDERKEITAQNSKRKWTNEQRAEGLDKSADRVGDQLQSWEQERQEYSAYLGRLKNLLNLRLDPEHPFKQKISDLVPELALGDNNSVRDLQNYVVGPSKMGMILNERGELDEERSFVHIDYFPLLVSQTVRNNPQQALSPRPIDFVAMTAKDSCYWLYQDDSHQLLICTDSNGKLSVKPVAHLTESVDGKINYVSQPWGDKFPLALFEDPNLRLPEGAIRNEWLSQPHPEPEWFNAIHLCRYSNGVIGIVEELSPVGDNVPGANGIDPILLRYERRRRQLVQADFHVFASDHWNFNARNFNPGGNHGSFLRISTHSVWMLAGSGVPVQKRIDEPVDSLNFGSTVSHLAGLPIQMPERVVTLR